MKKTVITFASTLITLLLLVTIQPSSVEADASCDIKLVFEYEVENLEVAFTDLSNGSYDKLWWEFGDGKTSEEANPKHKYNKEGIYTFCLKASCSQKGYTKDFCGDLYLFDADY